MGKILITGGCGFIGSNIARALLARGDDVVLYDQALIPERLEGISDKVEMVFGDIMDLAYLFETLRNYKIEKIVNTAVFGFGALSVHIGRQIQAGKYPSMMVRNTVEGALNVFEAVRLLKIQRVIDFSTVDVYGYDVKYEPVDEDHPKKPPSLYGASKLAAEIIAEQYNSLYGLEIISIRPSGVYGPYMSANERYDFPYAYVKNALEGKPIKLNKGGDYKHDRTYVKDVVSAVLICLDIEMARLKHRVFNISSGKATTISEMARVITELVPGATIEVGPGLLEGIRNKYSFSIERARQELGYQPKYGLREGLREFIEWFQKKT